MIDVIRDQVLMEAAQESAQFLLTYWNAHKRNSMIDEIHESVDRKRLLRIIGADRELINMLVSQRIAEWERSVDFDDLFIKLNTPEDVKFAKENF